MDPRGVADGGRRRDIVHTRDRPGQQMRQGLLQAGLMHASLFQLTGWETPCSGGSLVPVTAVTCIREQPQIALAQLDTLAFHRSSSFSIARWVSRASVGARPLSPARRYPPRSARDLVSIVPHRVRHREALLQQRSAPRVPAAPGAEQHQSPLSYNERYKHFERLIVLGFHLAW
jgi:hypothetical protein